MLEMNCINEVNLAGCTKSANMFSALACYFFQRGMSLHAILIIYILAARGIRQNIT